ncbi:MAG TPA: lipid-A-disaccharide synthase [Candidatus Hydrogenedentes bacterium]|nr:lipid-A-disaccharide synthase [Candidatus Hydrogenedentota bacterium]HOL75988.1 lipid-A-disaccharide synthase [Candidatus Hydrogenedentota bacterium]HPO85830.1 lipid-A-disaccharide synthase [Candidatus Hydrogenedentota bacterium]
MTRIFLVAGESSGDIHGANLVRALHALEPTVVCEGLGGQRMALAGMNLRYDLAGKAIMGFAEVVRSFPFIRRLFYETVDYLKKSKPDVLVLIDYPGFNIRLAGEAKRLGIPVVYYIAPQVWAWKPGRIHVLAERVTKVLVIFPFEEQLYKEAGVDCTYVGHPLIDHLTSLSVQQPPTDKWVTALLPGSREQEIRRIAPVMFDVARELRTCYPEMELVVPCVDIERERQVKSLAGDLPLRTTVGNSYEVLASARFCLVASGTATLEAAFFGVPMIILYRVATVSYLLARLLVQIEYIGMVNIIAGKSIVPEFIQHNATPENVLPVALELMQDSNARKQMIQNLEEVKRKLGETGASQKAAKEILAVTGKQA